MPRELPESVDTMPSKQLDLAVIDQAFGDFADLYSDVLRVSVAASPEQIQMAYYDRRSELFTILAKMDSRPQDDVSLQDRLEAERKMDSVVLAVRILGDTDQRLAYDRIRQERLLNRRRAEHGQLPGHEPRVGAGLDAALESEEDQNPAKSRRTQHRAKSSSAFATATSKKELKKRRKKGRQGAGAGRSEASPSPPAPTPPQGPSDFSKGRKQTSHQEMTEDDESPRAPELMSQSLDTDEMRQDDGDTTVYSAISNVDQIPKPPGYLACITNSRFMRRISDEISGACEDTLVSVDQVFNAFTLTDKDIRAVTKRIDKAKRQLDA